MLAVVQHNGLPTRCLDWTASPLVAAHFACASEPEKNSDGVIWCLHAGLLRNRNADHAEWTRVLFQKAWVFDTRLIEKHVADLDKFDEEPGELILLWEPPSLDSRIANQSGLFS